MRILNGIAQAPLYQFCDLFVVHILFGQFPPFIETTPLYKKMQLHVGSEPPFKIAHMTLTR